MATGSSSKFHNFKRILDKLPEKWNRRVLRKALVNSDISRLKSIVSKGYDVNAVLSEAFQDTALTWSVKHGHLEVVEYLVTVQGCDLDVKDRRQHTALDEAIKRWLADAASVVPSSRSLHSLEDHRDRSPAVGKHVTFLETDATMESALCGSAETKNLKRSNSARANCSSGPIKVRLGTYNRIIKCLLEAGANVISSTSLDMAVFNVLWNSSGPSFLLKLSKLVAEKGKLHIRSTLCSVLVTYRMTHDCIKCLLEAGADPKYYLSKEPCQPFMPTANALLLLRASNDGTVLSRIECDTTGNLTKLNDQQLDQLLLVLRLLVVCGHSLQLYVMNFLRDHWVHFYMWVVRTESSPRPLKCLSRIAIRKLLKPNVLHCYNSIKSIPEELKQFLLLSEWLVPKTKPTSQSPGNVSHVTV